MGVAELIFGVILVHVITIPLFTILGEHSGRQEMRREAILRGHAEYKSDDEGQPVFTWKTRT